MESSLLDLVLDFDTYDYDYETGCAKTTESSGVSSPFATSWSSVPKETVSNSITDLYEDLLQSSREFTWGKADIDVGVPEETEEDDEEEDGLSRGSSTEPFVEQHPVHGVELLLQFAERISKDLKQQMDGSARSDTLWDLEVPEASLAQEAEQTEHDAEYSDLLTCSASTTIGSAIDLQPKPLVKSKFGKWFCTGRYEPGLGLGPLHQLFQLDFSQQQTASRDASPRYQFNGYQNAEQLPEQSMDYFCASQPSNCYYKQPEGPIHPPPYHVNYSGDGHIDYNYNQSLHRSYTSDLPQATSYNSAQYSNCMWEFNNSLQPFQNTYY